MIALKAFLIGLVAGFLALLFRMSLEYIEEARTSFIEWVLRGGGLYLVLPLILFAVGVTLVAVLTTRYAPDASGSGIPHLKGYLGGYNVFRGWRILFAKFIGGVVGIGAGFALGREGPTVQMGAAIGKIGGDHLASSKVESNLLVSAGAGAGLAAAFNAPMAGVFFVLEELHSSFNQAVLIAAFVASVTADIVCRLVMGKLPVFHLQIAAYPETSIYPYFAVFGVFIGFLGLLFNKSLLRSTDYVSKMTFRRKIALFIGLGMLLGAVGLAMPEAIGTGSGLIDRAIDIRMINQNLLAYLFLRFVFTLGSYATGAPGGIFAPILLLGALSGSLFGNIASSYLPELNFSFSVWCVLGMAGYFSAVVRAPITGTILILEMTAAYDLLLPIMIVSIISYSIPELFKDSPIYEALLRRDLSRRGAEAASLTES